MAVILGFVLRMASARYALVGDKVLFYGYDSFYHMRRVFYTQAHFPHTLWFDFYLDHPYGLELMWPPLFDQIIAGLAIVLGAETTRSVEVIGAIVPPIIGLMTILALYYLARDLFGTKVALISGFVMAISPLHIDATCFGHTDHHVLEIFLLVSIILFLVLAYSRKNYKIPFAVSAGVMMAAMAYTWLGTPAYLAIFLIYAVLQMSLDVRDGRTSKETVEILGCSFGAALILILPFWNEPWIRATTFMIAAIIVILIILYALSTFFLKRGIFWPVFPILVIIIGYFFSILVYYFAQNKEIYSQLWAGLNYFFGGELSNKVTEATPLHMVTSPTSLATFSLIFALMGLLALVSTKRSKLQEGVHLFVVWTLYMLALTLLQSRFLYLFTANIAILFGMLVFWFDNFLDQKKELDKNILAYLKAIFFAILILPLALGVVTMVQEKPEISGHWIESIGWLEENTPKVSGFDDPNAPGEYGVLSWWDYGNWILYQSKRPVVANNFQAGAKDATRFFLSESEDEALNILDRRKARYIVTNADILHGKLPALVSWIETNPSEYVNIFEGNGGITFKYSNKFMRTILARCHLFDCNGMGHFRLIYESNSTVGLIFETSQVKVFEKVSGARITGKAQDDRLINVILNLTTDQGRNFQYQNEGRVQDGFYEITVPYSTEARPGARSKGIYRVMSGDESQNVAVTEMDVLTGRRVVVNF